MSLLRVRHPETPPRDVDLGPGMGRIHFTRYGTVGGSFVSPITVKRVPGQYVDIPTAASRATRERSNARKAEAAERHHFADPHTYPNVARCGALMRVLREPCARFAGHQGEHRSRYHLDNNANCKRRSA